LADVACTSRLFDSAGLPDWSPRYMHWLLAASRSLLHRTYLSHYLALHPGTRDEVSAWKALLMATGAAAIKSVTLTPSE